MSTIEKAFGNRQQPPAIAPGPFFSAQPPRTGDENVDVDIPFDLLHARGYLTPVTPRSMTAEEFRTIKRPLLKNIAGESAARIDNANLVMVTSPLEGDGKTFCSLNLAMSIAMEQDKTVLYIDADVHKASAGRLLGVPDDAPGLIDILMGNAEPEHTILNSSMDTLRIMGAGSSHEKATELLAGERMQQLIQELSTRYSDRVIIFDSPPLLLTNEASVLASFMGQIVFVAAANYTPQYAVQQALERIGRDKMVAMMLNKAPLRRFNFFGLGNAYGYGYGYGVREEANSTEAKAATP
ncbi:MAG: AAA family ATPase [Pseudohongiellaceae bacterium]